MTINKVLDYITTDYFLILDSDDTLMSNRLIYDLLYLNLKDTIYKIYGVQSKYYRKNEFNDIIVQPNFGENIITFRTSIIKKIGYYCNNRFGGDTEYLKRAIKILGAVSIRTYDVITYEAYLRSDNTNLTTIYNNSIRSIFYNKFSNILNKIQHLQLYLKKDLDYFVDLMKTNPDSKINYEFYQKCYKDLKNLNNQQLIEHWNTIGLKEGRLMNLYIFNKTYPNFDYKLYIEKNDLVLKLENKYDVFGWVYLKNKSEYENNQSVIIFA